LENRQKENQMRSRLECEKKGEGGGELRKGKFRRREGEKEGSEHGLKGNPIN